MSKSKAEEQRELYYKRKGKVCVRCGGKLDCAMYCEKHRLEYNSRCKRRNRRLSEAGAAAKVLVGKSI